VRTARTSTVAGWLSAALATLLVAGLSATPALGAEPTAPVADHYAAFEVTDSDHAEALLVLDVSALSSDEAQGFVGEVEAITGAEFVDYLSEDEFRGAEKPAVRAPTLSVSTRSKNTGLPNIKPNADRDFVRAEATLNIRNNNRAGTVNWGILLSASTRSIIVGNVNESGAVGYNGSLFIAKNAPHSVGSGYHFHGTFRVAQRPITFDFSDSFSFQARVGNTFAQGYLLVHAKVRLL